MLTQAHLRENLHYSIITGQFYWIKTKPKNRVKIGQIAGTIKPNGYRYIKIDNKLYLAHRLAWFYCANEWPQNQIDHINVVKDANYWLNLRDATNSQNKQNTGMQANNTSGFKGVTWHKPTQKWMAYISLNNKRKHLGVFWNIEDAHAVRITAEKKLYGEFARG